MSESLNKQIIPLSIPFLHGNELKYVKKSIDSGWISTGSFVTKFENEVANYTGTKFAISCINCTSAIHISLVLIGVGQNDVVIVPTLTFIAPVNAVKYVGAKPIFVDCDDFLNIDVKKIEEFCKDECRIVDKKLIHNKTGSHVKAIIPVHIFGNPVNMERLMEVAKKFNLKVIEDTAESLGSYYTKGELKGKKTGTIADLGCLSFNGNKIISAGSGGMIVSNNSEYAKRAKYLINQAKDDYIKYIHNEIGYNYRMNNLSAALGCAQFENLNKFIQIKRKNYFIYKKFINEIDGLKLIGEPDYGFSTFWFYSLLIDEKKYGIDKDTLLKNLTKNKIQCRPLWRLNHLQKPYRKCLTYKIKKANYFYKRILNLPCSVGLTEREIKKVVKVLKNGKKT